MAVKRNYVNMGMENITKLKEFFESSHANVNTGMDEAHLDEQVAASVSSSSSDGSGSDSQMYENTPGRLRKCDYENTPEFSKNRGYVNVPKYNTQPSFENRDRMIEGNQVLPKDTDIPEYQNTQSGPINLRFDHVSRTLNNSEYQNWPRSNACQVGYENTPQYGNILEYRNRPGVHEQQVDENDQRGIRLAVLKNKPREDRTPRYGNEPRYVPEPFQTSSHRVFERRNHSNKNVNVDNSDNIFTSVPEEVGPNYNEGLDSTQGKGTGRCCACKKCSRRIIIVIIACLGVFCGLGVCIAVMVFKVFL